MNVVARESDIRRHVIDDAAKGIFRVSRRAFLDEEILEREKRFIFDRCWIYAFHESEIPEPGSFLTRSVGGRKLIIARGKDGAARAFFNTCPHRGALVSREKQGTANMFRCFYHSWAFDLEGRLINRPGDETYAPETRENGSCNLTPVPRLQTYRDFTFVNYDRDAVDLETYLADAKEYLDLVADQSGAGMEIVGGTQDYGFKANWKLLAENSIDGYHGEFTHSTYFDYITSTQGNLGEIGTTVNTPRDLGNGHAVLEYGAPWGRPVAKPVPSWGDKGEEDTAVLREELIGRLGKERGERIAFTNRNLLIFPNLVINDIMAITIRTFFPEGPGRQRVHAWALAPKNEEPAMRQRRLFNFLEFLGPGGFATPDDCEALALCQEGYANAIEAGWNDLSKGMKSNEPQVTDELQMRAFWREWSRRVEDGQS